MKKIYILASSVLLAVSAVAQDKIDAISVQALRDFQAGTIEAQLKDAVFRTPVSRSGDAMVSVLVKVRDGGMEALQAEGIEVQYISRDFIVAEIPASRIEELSELPELVSMSFAKVAAARMDVARDACKVGAVHSGLGLGGTKWDPAHPYKGDGVIAAMYDTGFDPAHINWLDATGSENRLKYFVRTSNGMEIYTGDNAPAAPTDNVAKTHGTHVAGIMAGSYNGTGTYFAQGKDNIGKVPLYGVAPNAEMAIGAGSLTTASIVSGVRKLADYAAEQGKPMVVNLSLGSNIGPHDGSDSDVQALDQLAEETGIIICIAAGNEGDVNCHAGKTFTQNDSKLTVLFDNDYATEYVDVWSSTSNPFTVSLIVVEAATGKVVAKMPSTPGSTVTAGTGSDEANTLFKSNFTGRVNLNSRLSAENQRYNVYCSFATIQPQTANAGVYNVGLMVEGEEGARVDIYTSASSPLAESMLQGIDRPDTNGSISGMACGFNTICVGSFTTKTSWTNVSGVMYNYRNPGAVNSISGFSSWGELIDGRKMPFITAPGMGICSSYSGPYVRANNASPSTLVASAGSGTDLHYWGLEQGTSMACPYVSGVVALWLEADPKLTVDKIKNIMASTATKDSYVTNATVWGAGKVNAFDGIKEVIKQATSGIADVIVDGEDILISQLDGGRTIDVFSAGAQSVDVRLYTIGGTLAASASATGDSLQLSAANLESGVYIVRATDGKRTATRKIIL